MIDLEAITLAAGAHDNPEAGMCLLEAASYVAGEPFSDHPECVSPVIAAFGRAWNDCLPSDEDRDRLLKPLLPLLLNTRTTAADDDTRAWMACDWLVRVHTPAWLRLAGLTEHADRLAGMPELRLDTCPSIKPAIDAACKDAAAAWDAAWDAAGAAAWDAARDAARAAAGAAARDAAGDAAGDAARAAAGAAARDAAGDAAGAAAWAAARAAAWDAAGDAAWAAAGAAAWDAARAAARAAAGAALAPTVTELQASAQDLVRRMCEVGRGR